MYNTFEQFTTLMMVLVEKHDHAESTRCLVMTKILNLLGGFVDTRPVRQVEVTCYLDQYGIEIQVQSMSKKKKVSFFISRGPNRHVDESWHDQEEPPQDVEMVSPTRAEQSYARTSSIEETHASKQQEQSIPMNYPSGEFLLTGRRKWNDNPACDSAGRYSRA